MKLSRETEYGLMGLLHMARQPAGRVIRLTEVALAQDIPPSFLSKIFQKLAKHGLVRSHRGSTRGYSLARPAADIGLREMLEATEGPDLFTRCAFWHERCGDQDPCLLHGVWAKAKAVLSEEIERISLEDLALATADREGASHDDLRRLGSELGLHRRSKASR